MRDTIGVSGCEESLHLGAENGCGPCHGQVVFVAVTCPACCSPRWHMDRSVLIDFPLVLLFCFVSDMLGVSGYGWIPNDGYNVLLVLVVIVGDVHERRRRCGEMVVDEVDWLHVDYMGTRARV